MKATSALSAAIACFCAAASASLFGLLERVLVRCAARRVEQRRVGLGDTAEDLLHVSAQAAEPQGGEAIGVEALGGLEVSGLHLLRRRRTRQAEHREEVDLVDSGDP